MRRIYLAGFDVFRADWSTHGDYLKALCRQHGFEGLYPLDNVAPADQRGAPLAQWIYRANIALIEACDLVMANLNPFRGYEPDSGTAFEVGYAVARDKPVWVYTESTRTLVEQIAVGRDPLDAARSVDAEGYTVEDFGLPLNLMLACSATVVIGDAARCLAQIQAHYA
jgi:nucleoside 2-deoxyribosyltransferase